MNNTNGNGTPTFEPNLVPIFEPNQVLKNTDLNSIVTYLDSHNRLTRTHLIGMGIVCGLAVQPSAALDEIRITAGCGITSEGFFVQYRPTSGDATDQSHFTHYRDQPLTKNRLIPSASKDEQFVVKELISAAVASANPDSKDIHPLTNLTNFAQQVVLILCDWEDVARDSCLIDCDDRGRDRNFRLRFFLINKSQNTEPNALSAETLLRTGFDINSGQTLDAAFQGWFNVPDCQIDRLAYTTQDGKQVVDLTKILNFDDLMKAYYRVCKAGILSIDAALQQTHALFGPFISTFVPSSDVFANLRNRLRDILIGLVPLAIAEADPFPDDTPPYVPTQPQVGYGIQYFYDYLVELIAAFNELKDALFDLMDACIPDMARFPKYLLAGEVSLPTAECPRPSLYRHAFYQPPIYNGNQQRKQEVRHLYKRLEQMSEGFNLLPFYQTPLKITPSRTQQALLGEQAIPYYYNYPNIYPYWNYDACRKQRANKLPAYFRLNGLPNQRGYDLIPRIDWADFLRIEGHTGLPLSEAIKQIEQYKSDFNLAFDLVIVRLGTGKEDHDLLRGYFDDLEVEFDQIKADWQQKYNRARQTIQDDNVLNVLSKFDQYFFQHPDLAKIDAGLFKNDFLEKAKNPENYQFRVLRTPENAYQLVLNLEIAPVYRVAFVTDSGPGSQISRTRTFVFADATQREQNQKHTREIFAANFAEGADVLRVETDDSDVFRFVLSDGQENIELLGTDNDLPALLIRLEDETPYSASGLIDRYHDFDALFTFLKYFGENSRSLTSGVAVVLVSYYEFRALFHRYLLRLESVKKLQLFQEYAKQNRGLEHLGGVPICGTFVLVYTSDETVLSSLIASDSALTSLSDQQVNKIKAKAQFPPDGLPIGKRGEAITSERINQNVVIADFCLPYLCCSAYSSLNYVMAPAKPFIALPQAVYCEGDDNIYDFILDPPGGLLRGGDGIVDHNGNYAFQPSTVDADVTEPMNLTFFYIVDGVGSSYAILLLPHVEIQFSLRPDSRSLCVVPNQRTPIDLEVTPMGGQFHLSIDGAPAQPITVQNNQFDLGSLPFPTNQNAIALRFLYVVPDTDDYCGGTSEPRDLIVIRQPQAQIDYPKNEAGEAIGTLIHNLEKCSDLRFQIDFRNAGSDAETYNWQLNGSTVANSRDATIEIFYRSGKQAKVSLTVQNRHLETKTTCADTDEVTVVLPALDPFWTFNNALTTQPTNPDIIVLCRDSSRETQQEALTVRQAGGTFSISPRVRGLSISLSDASVSCERQTDYILNFGGVSSGTYTLTYTLPDGSQFARQVEVVVVPTGSFDLATGIFQEEESEAFEIRFTNVQPRSGRQSQLRYQWEITIGDRAPIITKERRTVLPYDGNIRPGEPISVVMRLTSASGLCETISEPKTDQVPMEVIRFELYQAFEGEGEQVNWDRLGEIQNESNFTISSLGKFYLNIRAITFPGRVGSVMFDLQVPEGQRAPETTPDNRTPYDLYRNRDDTQAIGWRPEDGSFTLTAIPFQDKDGEGVRGAEQRVTFTLRNG